MEKLLDGVLVDDDLNEPITGDKLACLNLLEKDRVKSNKNNESSLTANPSSIEYVHVLLKLALHADDRVILLDCLYTQDEKVSLIIDEW
ncbi:hypothetical protein PanWU01x14_220010 [Parasponia andersonii]|uniref:Uncharacterized protein n=1 Tax=Parasponia andersonii TaxID=3476 RepID=A0A2P5BQF0_PARAD|nr:hypothetical protein PanWU01x14_220010 [Parasponia andersonii]